MKIIIIGIQGAGKSTQGNLLSKSLGIPYLSSGHIFRDLSREHTPNGRYIKETMNAGYLIPDDKTLRIVEDYLKRPEYEKGFILDGFPRTLKQAEQFSHPIDEVIYLEVDDKEALWRLSYREGEQADDREDETLSALRNRIELFHKHTRPVLEYFHRKRKLIEVDGMQSIEDIHKEILKKVDRSK